MIRDGMVAFHEDLRPLLKPIDSVTQHEANYNNGDVEAIAESIEVNGMYRPIYVDRSNNQILAGNHTWEACKSLGATQIPVIYLDYEGVEGLRTMVADNRLASLARPDNRQLVALLNTIEAESGSGLHGSGFGERDLEALIHLAEIPVEYDEFAQWPTISVQVPPHVRRAYMNMTREADTDRDRFELVLRLAGWDGSK